MRVIKGISTFCSISLIAVTTAGCGILGDKDPASRILAVEQKNSGCLDDLGPQMEKYIDGEISEAEWNSVWVCLDDTLNTFVKFVKGSDPTGYTQEDVKLLVERFIITNKPITREFVSGVFAFKASLFGGDQSVISLKQVADFRSLIQFIRRETTILIPHLYNRKHAPRTENLRTFMSAVDAFGMRFADYLNTGNNPSLSRNDLVTFMTELTKISFPKITPEEMEQWTDTILASKYALVRGAENAIAGYDWKEIFRFGIRMGSTLITYLSIEDEDRFFEIEIAERTKSILNESVNTWNGAIPLSAIDRIVEVIPSKVIEKLGKRVDDIRAGIRGMLVSRIGCMNQETPIVNGKCDDGSKPVTNKPSLSRFLLSKKDHGIDSGSFQMAYEVFSKGKRAEELLEKIMGSLKEDLDPDSFVKKVDEYAKSLGGNLDSQTKSDLERLKVIAKRYIGLHPANSPEIIFNDSMTKHSQTNLSKMNWFELLSEKILLAYGTKANGNLGQAGTLEDLFNLVQDVNPLLISFSMVHPDKLGVYSKRFREANLFTPAGNGDTIMDLVETSTYFAFLFSSSKATDRATNILFRSDDGTTGICPVVGQDPRVQLPLYEIGCLRRELKANYREIFKNYPIWVRDYEAMNPKDQDHFWKVIESTSKPFGFNNEPMSAYDFSSFSGIQHFNEGLMKKFDTRGGKADGFLDNKEINDDVFPVFKNELAKVTKINVGLVNRAMLIWLAQYGTSPFKCGKPILSTWDGWKEVYAVVRWLVGTGPVQPIHADRLRIYEIFETLSNIALDPIPGCPKSSKSLSILEEVTQAAGEKWLKDQPEYQQALEKFPDRP